MLCGVWCPLGKNDVIDQWVEYLPQLKGSIHVFEGVAHFVEEVKPKEIAAAILDGIVH